MKVTQWSDWSSEPCQNIQRQNSVSTRNTQPKDNNVWIEDNNEKKQTNRFRISVSRSLLYGLLIGSLVGGIVLAVVVTVWLTSPQSASTNASSTLSSTALSITSSFSTSSSSSTSSMFSHTTATSLTVTTITPVSTSTTTTTVTSVSITTTVSTIITTSTTMIPPLNLLINPGAENGILSPWVAGSSGTPTVDNGAANFGYNPHSGTKQFYGGHINSGSYNTLTQSVLLLNGTQGYTEAQLDSGNLSVNMNCYERSYYQVLGTDQGQIALVFRTLNNTLMSINTTSTFACTNNWCAQSFSYSLPIGTRRIDYIMIFLWQTGSTIDSYFDDNSLTVY